MHPKGAGSRRSSFDCRHRRVQSTRPVINRLTSGNSGVQRPDGGQERANPGCSASASTSSSATHRSSALSALASTVSGPITRATNGDVGPTTVVVDEFAQHLDRRRFDSRPPPRLPKRCLDRCLVTVPGATGNAQVSPSLVHAARCCIRTLVSTPGPRCRSSQPCGPVDAPMSMTLPAADPAVAVTVHAGPSGPGRRARTTNSRPGRSAASRTATRSNPPRIRNSRSPRGRETAAWYPTSG